MNKYFRFSFFIFRLFVLSICLVASATYAQDKATSQHKQISLAGTDSNGGNFDLKNYSGKTVLVSFYSAGCSVCARDLKLMREFYRDNATKDFVLVGVNIDKAKSDFDSYAKIVALSTPKNQQFPLLWKGSLKSMEGVGNLSKDPTHFVINGKAEVILRREGTFKAEDWDNLWESLSQ